MSDKEKIQESLLNLWDRVEKTDPKFTKQANVKGNRLTSISPQYQIYNATKEWGPYGSAWGFTDIEFDYSLSESHGLVVFKAMFFYGGSAGGKFDISNSISLWKDNARTKIDDDFAKKVETDTLTKALSKLGFNADVFMGRFDDSRYVDEMHKEFKEELKPNHPRFQGALNYVRDGGDIKNVEKEFKITEDFTNAVNEPS